MSVKKKVLLATPTGFEPAISGLTGQYVKPLHHGAAAECGLSARLNCSQ